MDFLFCVAAAAAVKCNYDGSVLALEVPVPVPVPCTGLVVEDYKNENVNTVVVVEMAGSAADRLAVVVVEVNGDRLAMVVVVVEGVKLDVLEDLRVVEDVCSAILFWLVVVAAAVIGKTL